MGGDGSDGPWISTCIVPMVPCGILGHGEQHRPQMHQDHGPRHGPGGSPGYPDQCHPHWKHGPRISTWSQVADHTPGIHTALNGNRNHGHQIKPAAVGPLIQTWPLAAVQAQTTPWPQVAARDTQVGMVPEVAQSSNTNLASGGNPDQDSGHLCGPWWPHKPWTSAWTMAAVGS